MHKVAPRRAFFDFNRPALSRTHFVEKFCAHNDYDRPAPISDGISKKCAKVRFWIEGSITDDPDDQEQDGDQAERVSSEKRLFRAAGHGEIIKDTRLDVWTGVR